MGSKCSIPPRIVTNNIAKKRIKMILESDGSKLSMMNYKIRSDKEMVLIAVKNKGRVIKYASTILRDDYEVAKLAVKSYGPALRYVSPRLQKNKKIVLAAVNSHPFSIIFADRKFHYDVDLLSYIKKLGFDFNKHYGIKIYTEEYCVICNNDKPSMVFLPCGHMIICNRCYYSHFTNFNNCPKCRSQIYEYIGSNSLTADKFPIHY